MKLAMQRELDVRSKANKFIK